MSHRKVVLALLLGVCVLLFAAASAAPLPDSSAGSAAIRTTLRADLTLKTTLSSEQFSATAFHQKTCHCSCGFPCNQDDDCGPGGKCEEFISCCDRNQPNPSLQQSAGKSTRNGEMPVAAIDVKCK